MLGSFRRIGSVLALLSFAICNPATGWDLAHPLCEIFPEPIAVTPEAPPVGAPKATDVMTYEDRLAELVNEERWSNGQLAPLKRENLLDSVSETHSNNMADRDFFMHCDPDTLATPWDRMTAGGYYWSSAAENIAAGQTSPESVMATWMASGGHRANILSTANREVGHGHRQQAGDVGNIRQTTTGSCTPNLFNQGPWVHYWTQVFGSRSTVYPVVINREAHITESRDVDLYVYDSFAEMRFRNEAGAWSEWETFANDASWQLSSGNGTKTVHAEMRTGGTVRSASDTIILNGPNEIIFVDGFESGNTSYWSSTAP